MGRRIGLAAAVVARPMMVVMPSKLGPWSTTLSYTALPKGLIHFSYMLAESTRESVAVRGTTMGQSGQELASNVSVVGCQTEDTTLSLCLAKNLFLTDTYLDNHNVRLNLSEM